MIEIFKTNVEEISQAEKILNLLLEEFPGSKINFDLEDCDKILRIEGEKFETEKIIMLIEKNGLKCSVLE